MDGSFFDQVFVDCVEPVSIEIFATTLRCTYTLPRRFTNTPPTPLEHLRISSEMVEKVIDQNRFEKIHYVRHMIAITDKTNPNFCGVEDFLIAGKVSIDNVDYAVIEKTSAAHATQNVKLKKFGVDKIGNPHGGRR